MSFCFQYLHQSGRQIALLKVTLILLCCSVVLGANAETLVSNLKPEDFADKLSDKLYARVFKTMPFHPTDLENTTIAKGNTFCMPFRSTSQTVAMVHRGRGHSQTVALVRPGTAPCATVPDAIPKLEGLENVRERIRDVVKEVGLTDPPRLVAVSKTKPVEMLKAAYDNGQRDFGENYVEELVSKAPHMPDDTRWRYIGHLQSNKAKKLVSVPGLACVETVDRIKVADKLNLACVSANRQLPLGVMIQVDTSGEESKGGISPGQELIDLAKYIQDNCPRLQLQGLMTIGAPGDVSAFDNLKSCRNELANALGADVNSLELSMGMSGDFEEAIRRGSSNIRVGTSIFGSRGSPRSVINVTQQAAST